jgi:hypothetical protein
MQASPQTKVNGGESGRDFARFIGPDGSCRLREQRHVFVTRPRIVEGDKGRALIHLPLL